MRRAFTATIALLGAAAISACGSSSQRVPPPAAPPPPAASAAQDRASAADLMWHDFLDASEARDAVIAGDLEAVRAPLTRLAQRSHESDLPVDWLAWIEDMQREAERGARAQTLQEAAVAVAALGASCGACHRATRGGPEWAGDERGYRPSDKGGLAEKMKRHQWSAEELWLGLTGPLHPAWSRGSAALMNIAVPLSVTHRGKPVVNDKRPSGEGTLQTKEGLAPPPLEPETAEPRLDPTAVDLDAALRELRALGRRADAAAIPKEKRAVFGQIIARCGSCHAKLGLELQ